MAVQKINEIPGAHFQSGSSNNVHERKEILEKDLYSIVMNKIENCEIVNVKLSDTYGKEMLEALIRKWCKKMFRGTLVNYYTLWEAFTVVKHKDEEGKVHYYVHFDSTVWEGELCKYGKSMIDNSVIPVNFDRAKAREMLKEALDDIDKVKQQEDADNKMFALIEKEEDKGRDQ